MWQTGLSSRVVNETKKKIDTNILGPKNVPPNLIDIVEDKGKGGWAKGLADESRDRGKSLQPMRKGIRERMNGLEAKATRLTSHFVAMHFAIQGGGDRVFPWQRLGQVGQFHSTASPEQGAQTRLSDGEMPDCLELVEQNHEGHGRENELFQRLHHNNNNNNNNNNIDIALIHRCSKRFTM